MLIRFSVENFKSFNNKQELVLIPSKRLKKNKEHIIDLDNASVLRNATIYGANASGKTTLVEAISMSKFIITNKIPIEASKMFCRNFSENGNKNTRFEFDFYKNNSYYAYGFNVNMTEMKVVSEWLYKLLPDKNKEIMLFEREIDIKRIDLGDSIDLDETEKMKFMTYKIDFEENNKELFLKEMNRQKKIGSNSRLRFFKDVYEWFEEDLITILPDQPITSFEYFYGDNGHNKINQLIEVFDTGISKVKVDKISFADLKNKLPRELAEKIISTFKKKLDESDKERKAMLSLRTKEAFYNLEGVIGEEPTITTIMLEHGNAFGDFEFSEESDGTRRLFDLLDILISDEKNKVYIIDELERSLHPKLTYKFVELFFDILKNNNIQLIFTTHESTIMDQNLLRRDEIWFVERNRENVSRLYSLDRFKERYDKKLSKAYLEGRYGAIPILKSLLIKVGEI
ncbi:MAG: ATP/GTP-binding protein [Clostridiales bacterium]